MKWIEMDINYYRDFKNKTSTLQIREKKTLHRIVFVKKKKKTQTYYNLTRHTCYMAAKKVCLILGSTDRPHSAQNRGG